LADRHRWLLAGTLSAHRESFGASPCRPRQGEGRGSPFPPKAPACHPSGKDPPLAGRMNTLPQNVTDVALSDEGEKGGIGKMSKQEFFPKIVTKLPEADIPIEGVRSHLFQGESQQLVFMSFENDAEVSEHSHEGQWGVVLDGEIELTIEGKKYTFKKGDTYFIPKDVKHSARIIRGYKDLTFIDQKDRYKTKSNRPGGI
jgi:quercetin dioxygenase-like cupin family protein